LITKNIIIFASGNGSNAENIALHFSNTDTISIKAIFCNNPHAGVIERAKRLNIPLVLFDKKTFGDKELFYTLIEPYNPDLLVLAGFLWLIPAYLINKFSGKIINIHPALLPKYGGKGMYGHHIHEAVLAQKEKEHGITIHLVNEEYDKGNIIFQAKFDLTPNDDIHSVSKKISELEMHYYPEAIKRVLEI
jgi:phosphoribosylglycinamide formyltransferase-1